MKTSTLILPTLLLCGCVSFNTSQPPRIDAPLTNVLQQARAGNWRVRVFTDSMHEGRVTFVQPATVRIGTEVVSTAEIKRVERSFESDLGGKSAGALIGGAVGVGVGYLGVGFWEYGNERPCNAFCHLRIYVPAVMLFGIIGALTGAAVDPPTRDWTTVWER